jgi:hypothetical protein
MGKESGTFVDEAFITSGRALRSGAEIVTSPARNLYDSMSKDGGTIDTLKRHFAKIFGLRAPKMRGYYGRPLQHS